VEEIRPSRASAVCCRLLRLRPFFYAGDRQKGNLFGFRTCPAVGVIAAVIFECHCRLLPHEGKGHGEPKMGAAKTRRLMEKLPQFGFFCGGTMTVLIVAMLPPAGLASDEVRTESMAPHHQAERTPELDAGCGPLCTCRSFMKPRRDSDVSEFDLAAMTGFQHAWFGGRTCVEVHVL